MGYIASELENLAKSVFVYAGGQCSWDPQFFEKCEGNPIEVINWSIKTGV